MYKAYWPLERTLKLSCTCAQLDGLITKYADTGSTEGLEEAAYEVLGAVDEMAPVLPSDFQALWAEHTAYYALGATAATRKNFHLAIEYYTKSKEVLLSSEGFDLDRIVLGIEVRIEWAKMKLKDFNTNLDNIIRLQTLLLEKRMEKYGIDEGSIYMELCLVSYLLCEPKEIKRGLARLGKLHASACQLLGKWHLHTKKINNLLLANVDTVKKFGYELPVNESIPLLKALQFAASEMNDHITICEMKLMMTVINAIQCIEKFKPYWVIVLIVLGNYIISSVQK
jgi:hypothetical protein